MKDMKNGDVGIFRKVLKIKTILNQITQVSWNIAKANKKYDREIESASQERLVEIFENYLDFADEVKRVNGMLDRLTRNEPKRIMK